MASMEDILARSKKAEVAPPKAIPVEQVPVMQEILDRPSVEPKQQPVGFDLPLEDQRETGVTLAQGGIHGATNALTGFLSTLSDDARIDIVKNNIPGAVITKEGDTTFVDLPLSSGNRSIRTVLNRPGLSGQDVQDFVGIALQFSPAGAFSNLGKNLATRLQRSFTSGTATELARQGVSTQLGSEQDISPVSAAVAGAESVVGQGLGEAIVPVAKSVVRSIAGSRIGKDIAAATDDFSTALDDFNLADTIRSKIGIDLLPAQQTLSPSKLASQTALMTTEEGSRIGIPILKKQNQQAGQAVEDFLNKIGSSDSIKIADENFKKISESILIGGQKELNALFKEPFRRVQKKIDAQPEKLGVVVDSVVKRIEAQLKGTQNKTARRALESFSEELVKNRASINGVRSAKDEVDLVLDSLGVDTKSASAVKKARNQIKSAEKQLTAMLNKSFPELREINKRFGEKREEILGPIERSGFGKFAKLDDTLLKRLSAMVFDSAETNPQIIQQTKSILKKSNITDADQVFDDLLRLELTKRINRTKGDLDAAIAGDTSAISNLPAILMRGIFGSNQAQEKVLLRSLNPSTRKNALLLKEALMKAGAGRPGGSDTQPKQEALRAIESTGVVGGIVNWLKSPIKSTLEVGQEATRAAKRQAAAELAFNPKWSPQLTEINKLKKRSAQSEKIQSLLDKVSADILARPVLISQGDVINQESNEE